jgi:hypothetical protein
MSMDMQEQLERIRQLMGYVPHVVIATVNEDASPHNSPVFGSFDDKLHFFWSSSPESQHSNNIMRDGRVFMVMFDSHEGNGALYVSAFARQLDDSDGFDHGYLLLSEAKARLQAQMGSRDTYGDNGPQRLYTAVPDKLWLVKSHKDGSGAIVHDERVEIGLSDLLPEVGMV